VIKIKEIQPPDEKSKLCNDILRALPSWFGVESSIVGYTQQVRTMLLYAAFDGGSAIGFVALKIHNAFTAEICVIGILKEYHRQGAGKMLIERCEEHCKANGFESLTVKTLDESRESKNYDKTRLFYQSLGFRPLEVFSLFWDKDNPCLFMAKNIL